MLFFGHDCENKDAHSNSMIFNIKKMEVERFEPHGFKNYGKDTRKTNTIYKEFDIQFSLPVGQRSDESRTESLSSSVSSLES